jgi:large subunit ribosomal protein L28
LTFLLRSATFPALKSPNGNQQHHKERGYGFLGSHIFHSIFMSRVCNITGAKPLRGHKIHRRGLAKKKGGIGQHVTANTPRVFLPNLRNKRVWVPELNQFVQVRVSARGLKTINKNGAYATLKGAGLI